MDNSCITINDVGKSFNDRKVLNNINLCIAKGELFGLLGPSGAGKTTLIKLITGQIKVDEGMITVLGKNVDNFENSIYTNFGMVLDNTGLYKRMSCYDNLLIFANIYGIQKSRINDVLKQVGLDKVKKTAVDKLSKGMKQRLVLARALLHRPAILFLDEPTSGLDPNTAKSIHDLILSEKRRGATIFLTTHNMEEAHKLCDNVALLNEGKIVEYGSPAEICRRYNHKNQIRLLTRDEKEVCVPHSYDGAKQLLSYFAEDNVVSVHSTEPTLETVFMELTGRKFENDEY